MYGNAVVRRFRFNNLAIGSIGAVATVAVAVAVTSGKVVSGQVGFAVPVDAAFTGGLVGIVPARATSAAEITLYFANASAGALDPADTFDFDVFMFPEVGEVAQTV